MKLQLRSNKDFWAGMMLVGTGAAAMFKSRDYWFGSVQRMGPGFFPTSLSLILITFGVCIMVVGLRRCEKIQGRLSLRALIILPLSLILFGILIEYAGFIPAMVALVFVSASSGREFKLMEVLILTIALTGASAALFIWGLELPYPLLKGF